MFLFGSWSSFSHTLTLAELMPSFLCSQCWAERFSIASGSTYRTRTGIPCRHYATCVLGRVRANCLSCYVFERAGADVVCLLCNRCDTHTHTDTQWDRRAMSHDSGNKYTQYILPRLLAGIRFPTVVSYQIFSFQRHQRPRISFPASTIVWQHVQC